jgi:hypothetical protein
MKDDSFGLFQRIYAHLDDPDAMNGMRAKFTPSYSQELELLLLESNGKWDMAEYHYERLNSEQTLQLNNMLGHLNCLQKQGKYGMHSFITTVEKSKPESLITFFLVCRLDLVCGS